MPISTEYRFSFCKVQIFVAQSKDFSFRFVRTDFSFRFVISLHCVLQALILVVFGLIRPNASTTYLASDFLVRFSQNYALQMFEVVMKLRNLRKAIRQC